MMPGTRLLRFARLWFPPSTVSSVFEPLVADWHAEVQEARTRSRGHWINVRWRLAFLANSVMAAPRLAAGPVPAGLLFDLAMRAMLFGALGFLLQQAFGRRADIAGQAVIDTLPFALLPVVMRLRRRSDLPERAARVLVLQFTVAITIILALFAGDSWPARAAAAIIPMFVAFMGWRLSDARLQWTRYSPVLRWWLTVAMLASTWGLAVYPLKYALGMPLLGRFWGTDVQYLLAMILTALIQVDDWRNRRPQAR